MSFVQNALAILSPTAGNERNLRELETAMDRLVPFVGAGLSADFKYKRWKPLLLDMAAGDLHATVAGLLENNQYEEAAEVLVRRLQDRFHRTIQDTFDGSRLPRPLREGAVRHLPKIASGIVVTTNYDPVLEMVFEDSSRSFTRVFGGTRITEASSAIQLNERALLKLHGDRNYEYTRVLTLSDYQREYGEAGIDWEKPLPNVLRQLMSARPLLFVGCSLITDRTMMILAEVVRRLGGVRHFALLSSSEDTPARLEQLKGWGILPLFYPAGEFKKIGEFLGCITNALAPDRPAAPPQVRWQALTSFVGRVEEMAELTGQLIRHVRLVTLTGPGGSGKTRLAREAESAVTADFSGGVYFVKLDEIRESSLVLPAIAGVLGIKEGAAPGAGLLDAVAERVRGRQVLLVLDNFEHVMAAAAQIAELLPACPDLTVLVTSRERLQVQGEHAIGVGPLGLPAADESAEPVSLVSYPAVKLFVARAGSARRGFALTAENARTVSEICRQLDGLPLAIELAAAKLERYSPESLLTQLASRLEFLRVNAPGLPPRQRALEDSIAWSYQLLDTPEQGMFRRLGVFAGGFDAESAEAVCGWTDTGWGTAESCLESLANKSLLQWEKTAGKPRYHMLSSIQEFAREELRRSGEWIDTQREFLDFFEQAAESELQSERQDARRRWLEKEIGNLRRVLDLAVDESNAVQGLRLAALMRTYWLNLGHVSEGRERLARLLELDDGLGFPNPFRIDALQAAAMLASAQGDYPQARSYLEELLAIGRQTGDQRAIESAIVPLGMLARPAGAAGNLKEDKEWLLSIYREFHDEQGEARVLLSLGNSAVRAGELEIARKHLDRGLEIVTRLGDFAGITSMKFELASLALMNDDDQLAESILLEIVESARGESASMPLSIALVRLGTILTSRGELKEAAGRFQEALAISDKSGNTFMAADATYQLGQLELRSSNLPQAESWLRRNEKLQRGLGSKPGIANALLALGHVALARRQPPPGLDEALKIFRETGIRGGESAVLMAEGDGGMIMANYQDALTKFQEAREVYAAIGDKGGVANATLRIGHAHRERGELAEALEKYNQAAELYKEMPLPGGVANSMKFAGDMYRRQRDPGKAKTQYEAALQYSREHQEKAAEASCLFALGELFQEQKE